MRDVVRFVFYMPHDHLEIASGVIHAFASYLRAVGKGPSTLPVAVINDEEFDALNEEHWSYVQELLQPEKPYRFVEELDQETARGLEKRGYATRLHLCGGVYDPHGYELCYQARIPSRTPPPGWMSFLTATLPTEFLELHGAAKVRELALDMASQLRFITGHAGLALRLSWTRIPADDALRAESTRYPGMDLRTAWLPPERLGTRIDGVHWLNFFAQPVLGQVGGAETLRSRLQEPGTEVLELDPDRIVVSLGAEPEAGDLSLGRTLPAYRELARVLEPWLEPVNLSELSSLQAPLRYSELRFTEDEARRWWRRFL